MVPNKVVIENFLSHSHSVIDFSKFDIALIVGAYEGNEDQSNGSGKSAVFSAIVWVLFGKSRHRKKDGVVRNNAKCCVVEFYFSIEDKKYKIIRKRDKVLAESDVIFEHWNNGRWENISCDTNTATDRKIVETINVNSEVFLNSVYFKQNDISMFAEAKPSQRKDILRALLRMEKWDAYQKKARDLKNSFKAKMTEKESLSVPMADIKKEIKNCSDSLVDIRKELKSESAACDKYKDQLMALRAQYQRISDSDATLEDLRALQEKFAQVNKRLEEIDQFKQKNNKVIKENTSSIKDLQQTMGKLNDIINAASSINIEATRKNLMSGRTKEKVLEKSVAELKKDVELKDECGECGKALSKADQKGILDKRQAKLKTAIAKHAKVRQELKEFEKKAAERELKVKMSHDAVLEKSKIAIKGSKLKSDIERCIKDNVRFDEDIMMLRSRDYEKEIADIKAKFDKDECERLEAGIRDMITKLKVSTKKRDDLNIKYGSLTAKKKELIEKEKYQVALNAEIAEAKDKFAIYDKLYGYFGKEGVQAVVIENVIGELEEYSNEILSKICNEPTALKIRTQRQNENGSWAETFDIEVTAGGRTDEFDTFSGGEKFRISFSLRLALSKILSKRMGGALKFLLLDEVSSSLDDKGLNMFINIVKQLSADLKIMVITHDEKLKESFDDIFVVNKGPSGSSISLAA